MLIKFPNIPKDSILGLNYSGMHDSSIAIVEPSGRPVFAVSLERISRVKQDSRPPYALLEGLPWDCISKVAVSTEAEFIEPEDIVSKTHPVLLPSVRNQALTHNQEFYQFLETLPCEKEFVCHQLSHASSAFWGSGFDEALCFTYDGGMSNTPWFGGVYQASRENGITALDQFSAMHYAKITSLYTVVTAVLGFTPNKHEGKITGLAAFGASTEKCRNILLRWFEQDFFKLEATLRWVFSYSDNISAQLIANVQELEELSNEVADISKEDLAATLQEITEQHVLDILARAKEMGWVSNNICLAGGLFANVKLNQRIVESGFNQLFVAPPMTDDGTALGAAWDVLSRGQAFNPSKLKSMYLGPSYSSQDISLAINALQVKYEEFENPASKIAALLAQGKVVAIYQGGMELGPRALGNRSILAQATASDINQTLNDRLNRTEFMPFAPVSRMEDADSCYEGIGQVRHAAEFMTVTVNCTEEMKQRCPAVVHVDGTARPQLVSKESNLLIYDILTHYGVLTGNKALVNTSFNIHEEPIVCSPEDALKGFFVSGLDYLYFEGGGLIDFSANEAAALHLLQGRVREPSQKLDFMKQLVMLNDREKEILNLELQRKEEEITKLIEAQNDRLVEAQNDRLSEIEGSLHRILEGGIIKRTTKRVIKRMIGLMKPRLGHLNQYPPRELKLPEGYNQKVKLQHWPSISIVTPAFAQGHFIERTIKSVLDQEYPNLEYFIQDGGSKDETVGILKQYEQQLSGWKSEPDSGQSQAINRGMVQTSGEIMAWLNSDDLLLPGTLAYVAEYFSKHPEVDVVYGHRLIIDGDDQEIGRWIMPAHDDEVLSWGDYVPQETLFWRRSIWKKVGGKVDEEFRFAMDWDLILRFRDAGADFRRLPRFMGAFRVHAEQKTSSVINEIGVQEMDVLRERVLGYVPSHGEIRKGLTTYMINHVITHLSFVVRKRLGEG